MQVTNAVYPEREAFIALLKQGHEGPIRMINLLKFREKAKYPDNRDSTLSGREAYTHYWTPMLEIVTGNGGNFITSGPILGLAIGSAAEIWDYFALVAYPSLSEFARIASLPEVAKIGEHREAGLAGQLLIPVGESENKGL